MKTPEIEENCIFERCGLLTFCVHVPEILRLIVTDALNNNRFAVDCCKTKTGLN